MFSKHKMSDMYCDCDCESIKMPVGKNQSRKAPVPAMRPAMTMLMVPNKLRSAVIPVAALDLVPPEAPVAWAEPGAPELRVTTPDPGFKK